LRADFGHLLASAVMPSLMEYFENPNSHDFSPHLRGRARGKHA
jgi:hypothetical protein